jgi:hypothetical protein
MREIRTYGSVRGVRSNPHPYRDYVTSAAKQRLPQRSTSLTVGEPPLARRPRAPAPVGYRLAGHDASSRSYVSAAAWYRRTRTICRTTR